MTDITWNMVAGAYPEFVQWIVQTQGGLPEGPVKQEDYEKFAKLYQDAR